jgi:hypothetical protein
MSEQVTGTENFNIAIIGNGDDAAILGAVVLEGLLVEGDAAFVAE